MTNRLVMEGTQVHWLKEQISADQMPQIFEIVTEVFCLCLCLQT